jgi:hypothetical protein
MVAIGKAESSLNTTARHTNTNGSVDIGWLQINDRSHPQYSESCLLDAACCAKAGYAISSHGTNFMPWCTYKPQACGGRGNNAYAQYMDQARAAVVHVAGQSDHATLLIVA